MKLRATLFAMAALCGSTVAQAGNGNAIDPTAGAAVQVNVAIQFGPTSVIGAHACTNPTTYLGVNTCPAVTNFNIPNNTRFVITNISGTLGYNSNGGGEVIGEALGMLILVGNTEVGSVLPADHAQVVGNTTYYTFNKSVHMFADAAVAAPEILVTNFGAVGPFFQFGTGFLNLTFQGYYVPIN